MSGACNNCSKATKNKRIKYCSAECRDAYQKELQRKNCPVCGTEHTLARKTCSSKCREALKAQTNLKKYGSTSPSGNTEVKKKTIATNMERYGVPVSSKAAAVKATSKETCQERYGVDYTGQAPEVKQKIIKTLEDNGGVGMARPSALKKYIGTCKDKYGFKNAAMAPEVKQKARNTFNRKYGVDAPFQDPVILQKMKQGHYDSDHWVDWRLVTLDLNKTFDEQADELDVSVSLFLKNMYKSGQLVKQSRRSKLEIEFEQFLTTLVPADDFICNDRKVLEGKEIDFLLPDLGIGFELNGIVYHATNIINKKPVNYHLDKTKLAASKGVRLVHITDFQWNYRKAHVKSIVRNILNKTVHSVYARNCYTKEISKDLAHKFLTDNHVSSSANFSSCLALIEKSTNNIIAVMTTKAARHNHRTQGALDIVRFATLLDHNAPGAFSKLLKHTITELQPKVIYSYCDLSLFTGSSYESQGFTFVRNTKPTLWFYVRLDQKPKSWQSYRKPLLQKLMQYDEGRTLVENQTDYGLIIYADVGNSLWKLEVRQ